MILTKYKIIRLVHTFVLEPTKYNMLMGSLIEDLFMSHSDNYDSLKKLNDHKKDMFNTVIQINSDYHGYMIFSVIVSLPDPRIVGDNDLFKRGVDLLAEIIYNHKKINQDIFKNKIINQLDEIESISDNKIRYAGTKFYDLFFEKADFPGISDTSEFLHKVTVPEVNDFYYNVLLKRPSFSYINGPYTKEEKEYFDARFNNSEIKKVSPYSILERESKLIEFSEEFDNPQSLLFFGLQFDTKSQYESICGSLINNILGASSVSRLFTEIRENLNLCYDIYSSYNPKVSSVFIQAGIDPKNLDFCRESILKVLADFKEGVTEEELKIAKKRAITSIYYHESSQMSEVFLIISGTVTDIKSGTDARIKIIDEVKLDDINTMIRRLSLKMIYEFRGKR